MTKYPPLALPDKATSLLLHVCCAPCSGAMIERLIEAGAKLTVYFYNPNIHPSDEYERRKQEIVRFCTNQKIPCIDGDYDTDKWFERIAGLESEHEGGLRCTQCFDLRLERTALFAHENNFPVFATSLGISRWKNMEKINERGYRAAALFSDLLFWDYNWRKDNGSQNMVDIAKREKFYQQEYCGCVFSLRDANKRRQDQGKPEIVPGAKHYGDPT